MAISITRMDHPAAELRDQASRAQDGASARRLLALALVMEGKTRTEAAISCGMDRQTLRDWVHRYNAEGLAGLTDRPHTGRRPRLTAAQEAEIARIVKAGSDLEAKAALAQRACEELSVHAMIEEEFLYPAAADALPPYSPNLANGQAVFNEGGCASCHAVTGQARTMLGGGLAIPSPFGTFYAPNISPDVKDGIGSWTEANFVTALWDGTSPRGKHYYPALPYTSYQRMKLEDVVESCVAFVRGGLTAG